MAAVVYPNVPRSNDGSCAAAVWQQTKSCCRCFLCCGIEGFFFLSLALYWSFFPFLSLIGFFFCAMEGGEVATEEERGGGHADETN
jgi:hypothetical protein